MYWKTFFLVVPLYELYLHSPPFHDVFRRVRYNSAFGGPISASIFPRVIVPSPFAFLELIEPIMRRDIAPCGSQVYLPSQTIPVFVPPSTTLSVISVPGSKPVHNSIAAHILEDIQARSKVPMSAAFLPPIRPSITIHACLITAVMSFVAGSLSMIFPRCDSQVPMSVHIFRRIAIRVYIHLDLDSRLQSLRILLYWAIFTACGTCAKLRTYSGKILHRGPKSLVAWVRRLDLRQHETICNWALYGFILLAILGDRISNTDNVIRICSTCLSLLLKTPADNNVTVGKPTWEDESANLSQYDTGSKMNAASGVSKGVDKRPSLCARFKSLKTSTVHAVSEPHSNREIRRSLVQNKTKVTKPTPVIDPRTAELYDLGVSQAVNLADYHICDEIGSGGCGTVFKAAHRTLNKIIAVKRMPADIVVYVGDDQCLLADLECSAMLRVQTSPWYPSLLAFVRDQGEDVIAMPYYSSGDLFDVLEKYGGVNRNLARFYTAQLMIAIHNLHKEGIIHRDIKPENIMFDDKRNLVLTDFGCATLFDGPPGETDTAKFLRQFRNNQLGDDFPTLWATTDNPHLVQDRTPVGTDFYYAPEVACLRNYSYGVDYYSMGITLFQMLTGRLPYIYDESENPVGLDFDPRESDYQDLQDVDFIFLLEVLCLDQFQRPGLAEMKAYDIFSNLDWKAMEARQVPVPPLIQLHRKDLRGPI